MTNPIPQDIRDFLTDCIESVSQLELLFIIFDSKNTVWTPETISREMRTHTTMALKQMEVLHAKGILQKKEDSKFTYAPVSKEIEDKIKKLHVLYHERPVAIVTFIFTKPEDKLKGFADAFKFKKD